MIDWERAISHFLTYVPKNLDQWIVTFDRRYHTRIVSKLCRRLAKVTALDINEVVPDYLSSLGETSDRQTGFVNFGLRYLEIGYPRDHPVYALDAFTPWPPSRVRMCFDVWDSNFCELFSEPPADVLQRCNQFREHISLCTHMTYTSSRDARNLLELQINESEWTVYCALDDSAYVLPSGEVACLPQSVDGMLHVTGWVIGTIPFGLKYGYVKNGDLVLHVERKHITNISGNKLELCRDVETALHEVPGLQVVAELGIGQSKAVTAVARKHRLGYLWHERHFGLHLGLGAELPETLEPGARRSTGHHLDVVLSRGVLATPPNGVLLRWP